MNKEQARKEEAALLSRLEEVRAVINKPDFEPDRYDDCWETRANGAVSKSVSCNTWHLQGDEWPTERDAKIASLRIKILNYLGHARLKLCPDFVEDWDEGSRAGKFTPWINYKGVIRVNGVISVRSLTEVYFNSQANALQVGEWVLPLIVELDELMRSKL